jgi:hypothetical protein
MIHDFYNAAGRLHGFFKHNPSATPDHLRKWLEIIDSDQSKSASVQSRFEGFNKKNTKVLRRFAEDIDVYVADGLGERAIHSALKKRYIFAKHIPSASTIRRFLERKNA